MQADIQKEILLFMNIDNTTNANEEIKILKICTDVLSNQVYMGNVIESLNVIFNQDNFNISTEFGRLILCILSLNKNVDYYKYVDPSRMKYVIYSVMYSYLIKNQIDWINKQNIGEIRLHYSNSFELLMIVPQSVKIDKINCVSCVGKSCRLLSWLSGSKISI